MISKENLNQFSVLGFLGVVGLQALIFCIDFLNFLGIRGAFLSRCSSFLGIVQWLAFLALAGIYGLMFLTSRDIMDAGLCGTLGLAAVVPFLFTFLFRGVALRMAMVRTVGLVEILINVVCSLYFLVLALRVRTKNQMFMLLCGCAFVFLVFNPIVILIFYRLRISFLYKLVVLAISLGKLVCAGIAFLAAKTSNQA